jgi:hypothetical protein
MSILLQHNSGRSSLLFVNYFFAKTTLQQPWWVHLEYLPYTMLRKTWQWYLLTMLRQTFKTKEINRLVDACYQALSRGVCDERAKR